MKHILVIFQKCELTHETLSMVSMMHHFGFNLQWVWMGEGVRMLTPSFQMISEETGDGLYKLVSFYPSSLFVEETSLIQQKLNPSDFVFPVQILPLTALTEKITEHDIVFTF